MASSVLIEIGHDGEPDLRLVYDLGRGIAGRLAALQVHLEEAILAVGEAQSEGDVGAAGAADGRDPQAVALEGDRGAAVGVDRLDTGLLTPRDRSAVDQGTGIFGRPVAAVGADSKQTGIVAPRQHGCRGQRQMQGGVQWHLWIELAVAGEVEHSSLCCLGIQRCLLGRWPS